MSYYAACDTGHYTHYDMSYYVACCTGHYNLCGIDYWCLYGIGYSGFHNVEHYCSFCDIDHNGGVCCCIGENSFSKIGGCS